MKRLVVIGGSAPSSFHFDRSLYQTVIAADSGYDTARALSIPVDDVVGDLDSTCFRAEIEALGFRGCSHDKDYSDTELALMKGSGPYDLLGGGEGRLDHTLSLFSAFTRMGYPGRWFMRVDTILAISGEVIISAPAGTGLSFFAVEDGVRASSEGLVWELSDYPLSLLSVSLSNRAREEKVRLSLSGKAMMRVDPSDYSRIHIEEAGCFQ